METIASIIFLLVSLFLCEFVVSSNPLKKASLVATFISRNEAVNYETNLALWLPVVDYFVFLIDR